MNGEHRASPHAHADVLVVDDDTDLREMIALLLEESGHEVRMACHGEEALRLLDERFPALVISDVEMPVLDGPAMVYRMFIENLGRENIPLVLISALDSLPAVAEAVGTPYFLVKPFDPEQLLAKVDRALAEATPPRPLRFTP
jgi:DNA-binding NtrC family response regulator